MSRPALSALRALEILDLLGGAPEQALTLSEIMRLTGTNAASCHAILSVLVAQGYLLRHPTSKMYRLAPLIVALGTAAAEHDELLSAARRAGEAAAKRSGFDAVLTARAGCDIVAVAWFPGPHAGQPKFRVGQRVPIRPPLGGPFVAWASSEEQDEWIAPKDIVTSPELQEGHRAALERLRARGFLVTLDTDAHGDFSRIITDELAMPNVRDPRLARILDELDNGLYQPDAIEACASYRVRNMAAPIFDPHGIVQYVLNLNVPPDDISGEQLLSYAQMLVELCAVAMRDCGISMPDGSAEQSKRKRG